MPGICSLSLFLKISLCAFVGEDTTLQAFFWKFSTDLLTLIPLLSPDFGQQDKVFLFHNTEFQISLLYHHTLRQMLIFAVHVLE